MSLDYYSLNNMPLGDDDEDYDDDEEDYGDDGDMSETDVEEKGALSQIGSSFKNMLVGLLCFIMSWPVLFCGASRVEWSKVFKNSVPVAQAKEGKPSYVTGTPVTVEIGFEPHLSKGKYLSITKSPQVYAYVETSESKSKTKRKGITRKKVKKTTTTYSYALEWTSNPKEISTFKQKYWKKYARRKGISPNIKNPTLTEKSETEYTPSCTVEEYSIDIASADMYGGSKDLGEVYIRGAKGSPRFGNKRVKYTGYPSDIQYTFAGAASGKKLDKFYKSDEDAKLAGAPGDFRALLGQLKSGDKLAGWLWFIGGFLLMAIGLVLLVGPLTTVLEFIPFLDDLGSGLIKGVLVLVALILSAVFYYLIYYWWIVLIIVAAIAAFIIYKKKSVQPAAA